MGFKIIEYIYEHINITRMKFLSYLHITDKPDKNQNNKQLLIIIIASILTGILLLFFNHHGKSTLISLIINVIFAIFGAGLTYFILRTGKINRFRIFVFVIMGILFSISFTLQHIISRGTILLTSSVVSSGTTPICPITIPFVSVPLVLEGKMIFPSTIAALMGILFLWLSMVILLGRGWCSWICFFGWMCDFFASIPKKALINIDKVPKWTKLLPYAFMLFFILAALITLEPLFCSWVCPLRIVYDPPMVTNSIDWIRALIFVIGGFILLIGGPLLTKKRLFCSFFCPLLPANAIIGYISPFRVKVDHEKCINCQLCVKACNLYAMSTENSEKPVPTIECARCGNCMDRCPKNAIDYTLVGTSSGVRPWFIAIAVTFCLVFTFTFTMKIVEYLMTGTIS